MKWPVSSRMSVASIWYHRLSILEVLFSTATATATATATTSATPTANAPAAPTPTPATVCVCYCDYNADDDYGDNRHTKH